MYKEKIVNVETGEETWRDYTPEEIAQVEQAKIEAAERAAKELEAAQSKAAVIEKLGITEEEAKLLLS